MGRLLRFIRRHGVVKKKATPSWAEVDGTRFLEEQERYKKRAADRNFAKEIDRLVNSDSEENEEEEDEVVNSD